MEEPPRIQSPSKGMPTLRGIENAYTNGDFCDAVIVCQGHEWKVHKLILSSQSDAFRKMFLSDCLEATTGRVDLSHEHPRTVDAMISYLYTRDYADDTGGSSRTGDLGAVDALVLDVRVFIIADQRFIPGLKRHAASKFKARATVEWESASFAASVEEAYETGTLCDRAIYDVLLDVIKDHAGDLFRNTTEEKPLRILLGNTHEFATDLAMTLVYASTVNAVMTRAKPYKCLRCGVFFAPVFKADTAVAVRRIVCPAGCLGPANPFGGGTPGPQLAVPVDGPIFNHLEGA